MLTMEIPHSLVDLQPRRWIRSIALLAATPVITGGQPDPCAMAHGHIGLDLSEYLRSVVGSQNMM